MDIPGTIYHYCPPEAFLAIVASHSFRLTHTSYFEDQLEHVWFEQVVLERLQQREPGLPDPQHKLLAEHLEKYKFSAEFCGSFSTEADMLPQWRAYADNGRGFAIGFSTRKLRSLIAGKSDMELVAVEYDRKRQDEAADRILDVLASSLPGGFANPDGLLSDYLTQHIVESSIWAEAPKYKSPPFSPEKEVRLIGRNSGSAEFRMRGSHVVPFVTVNLQPDQGDESVINEIMFGPRIPIQDKNVEPIRMLMERNGYQTKHVAAIEYKNSSLRLI
jgi:hypothetical protein